MRAHLSIVLACALLSLASRVDAQARAYADRAPAPLVSAAERCEGGDADGCTELYRRYRERDGLPSDGAVTRELLASVCDARAYVTHSGGASEMHAADRRARPCFRELATVVRAQCDAGDGAACLALVSAYRVGHGVPRSDAHARALLQTLCDAEAASATRASACDELGAMIEAGVRAGRARALPMYERACGDSAVSCERLGALYEQGTLGPVDLVAARARYDRACHVGQIPHACDQLTRLDGPS